MNSAIKALGLLRRFEGGASVVRTVIRCQSTNKATASTVKLSNFDKKILVWTGKYKNASQIPDTVSHDVMEKARSRFRIKYANYGLLASILVCAYMIYQGKQAAERGETVHQMNLDWHSQQDKEFKEAQKKN